MTPVPPGQKVYHITHLQNLPEITRAGGLYSDAVRLADGLNCTLVGMADIKRRRLMELEVGCHPGTKVGGYVPFYFCPRSIMLYILHMGNHPDIDYRDGQRPIVHLQVDLHQAIQWAEANRVRWAFSDRNAGTRYTNFYRREQDLEKLNWPAVQSTDFRDMVIRDSKQAEFLLWEFCPWQLVEKIGVINADVAGQVTQALTAAGIAHNPVVSAESSWYF